MQHSTAEKGNGTLVSKFLRKWNSVLKHNKIIRWEYKRITASLILFSLIQHYINRVPERIAFNAVEK